MSTLPRPTGKELVRAWNEPASSPNELVGATIFSGIQMAAQRLFPYAHAHWA